MLLESLKHKKEVCWSNPNYVSFEEAIKNCPLSMADVADASARLQRFAPYFMAAFPETVVTGGIVESPFREISAMKAALEVFPIVKAMAVEGNPASVSDAGVGALAARSAVLGAQMNVRINAAGLADREAAEKLCAEAAEIAAAAIAAEEEVLEIVNGKL